MVRWVQVKLRQWTTVLRTWATTTVRGLHRAWRAQAAKLGRSRRVRGRELRRSRHPHRRLEDERTLDEEGIVNRDTLVAVLSNGAAGEGEGAGAGRGQRGLAPQPPANAAGPRPAARRAHPDKYVTNKNAALYKFAKRTREELATCEPGERARLRGWGALPAALSTTALSTTERSGGS